MTHVVSVLVLVCLSVPVLGQQTYDREVESRLIALERLAKLQACAAKDLKTLDQLLDDAFVYVDQEGQLQKKADLLLYVQNADSLRFLTRDMIVRVHGDTAIVTGLFQLKAIVHGKPFVVNGRFVDTWLNKSNHWVVIASLTTP